MHLDITQERFITNSHGDKYLYSISQETFNESGAEAAFKQRYTEELFLEDTLYLIIGTDSGLLARYVDKKGVPKGSKYYFVEPQPVLDRIREVLELESDRIFLVSPDAVLKEADKEGHLGAAYYAYAGKIEIFMSLTADKDIKGLYRGIRANLKEEVSFFIYHVRVTINNKPHITNHILNSVDTLTPANSLFDIFHGKTAVVLSAGPSLDEFISWLKEIREKVVIIAISRIARRLQQVAIVPDIIVTVDPSTLSFDISKDMLRMSEPLLLFSSNAVPQLVSQWPGRKAYLGNRFYWETELNVENCETAPPTVSNTAINIAAWMGCQQIVLLGLDSCFSPDGTTYSAGSIEHSSGVTFEAGMSTVETNSGEMAQTLDHFINQIHALSEQASFLARHGYQLLTPASHAAKIQNIAFVPADQIELKAHEAPARGLIELSLEKPDENDYLESLEKEFNKIQRELATITTCSQSAIRLISDYLEGSAKELPLDRVRKLKEEIDACMIAQTLRVFGWSDFTEISELIERVQGDMRAGAEANIQYFETFLHVLDEFGKLIIAGLDKIRFRREEQSDHPDLDVLVEGWSVYDQKGRAKQWALKHQEQLSGGSAKQHREAVDALVAAFDAQLDEQKTAHTEYTKERSDLNNALYIILQAVEEKSVDRLEFLVSALARHGDPKADDYLVLARGCLAEVREDYAEAQSEFDKIVEKEGSPVLKSALEHIVFVSNLTGDLDRLLYGIECLAHVYDEYQPTYAEMLAGIGENAGALQVYEYYCSTHPNDVEAGIKYAQLARQFGELEKYNAIVERLSSIDPDNSELAGLQNNSIC